jgi:hypothetical protein
VSDRIQLQVKASDLFVGDWVQGYDAPWCVEQIQIVATPTRAYGRRLTLAREHGEEVRELDVAPDSLLTVARPLGED